MGSNLRIQLKLEKKNKQNNLIFIKKYGLFLFVYPSWIPDLCRFLALLPHSHSCCLSRFPIKYNVLTFLLLIFLFYFSNFINLQQSSYLILHLSHHLNIFLRPFSNLFWQSTTIKIPLTSLPKLVLNFQLASFAFWHWQLNFVIQLHYIVFVHQKHKNMFFV